MIHTVQNLTDALADMWLRPQFFMGVLPPTDEPGQIVYYRPSSGLPQSAYEPKGVEVRMARLRNAYLSDRIDADEFAEAMDALPLEEGKDHGLATGLCG